MSHLLWNISCELVRGCLDAFRGLWFVSQLDKDEEYVVVNSAPRAAPKTVMQQRREQRGTVARPAERIYRRRERVWKRYVQLVYLSKFVRLGSFLYRELQNLKQF
ncbi:hypothetical protein Y032_0604g551 [Ancylostoma ceylanicum]|uniref:Uncharacterized protein n=1 Tax=Ancylostoma ceylanicum TaxID=53326 RepID=A0A016WLV1_9BILA|nr:hypothetical protein Y032_0604g551 [Ancylostoma ceylanicum]